MGTECSICDRTVATVTSLSMCVDCNLAYENEREDQRNAPPVPNLDYCIGFVVQTLENKIMEEAQVAIKEWINKNGYLEDFINGNAGRMRTTIKDLIWFKDHFKKDSK